MRIVITLIIIFFLQTSFAQSNLVFGGSKRDFVNKALKDKQGNIYTVGYTRSSDILIDTLYGSQDAWVQKLDSNENIIWSKAFGGRQDDVFNDFIIINDKIYCVGATNSDSGNIVFNHGNYDFWLCAIDTGGNLLFDSCYGGQNVQWANSILQYSNSNLVISGYSDDTTGQVSVHFGGKDFWFIEVDTLGNLIREKSIGGPSNDLIFASAILPNGDILFGGITNNPVAAFSNYHGANDAAVACLDSNWNSKWQKCYGETSMDAIYNIFVRSLDTVLFTGYSYSLTPQSFGGSDAVIWQTDRVGVLSNTKLFGGGDNDYANRMIQNNDSTYLIIGSSKSYTGQLHQNYGSDDVFVFTTDLSLSLLEANNYGGSNSDRGVDIFKNNDSSYCIIANSMSDDIQVPYNFGLYDLWILDTVFTGNPNPVEHIVNKSAVLSIYPNPSSGLMTIVCSCSLLKAISVYDINGKLSANYMVNSNKFTLDGKNFQPGFYFIKAIDKKGKVYINKVLFF